MKKKTKQLARQVQQALLALSDTILLEEIDHWLSTVATLFEDIALEDSYYETFGYRVKSKATSQQYPSLDDLFEVEPEVEEIIWVPPRGEDLRATLQKMQLDDIYHQVVALAGNAFQQKSYATRFGKPPDNQSNGYAFIQNLVSYLELRKEGEELSTEQFEKQYQEQLEKIAVEGEESFDPLTALFIADYAVHFRMTFRQNNPQHYRDLQQALEQYDCIVSPLEENTMKGTVFYRPGHHHDLKMLTRVRRVLNHWQQSERISVEEWKEKPQKRLSQKKRERKLKRN
jgi:hypothetical protein